MYICYEEARLLKLLNFGHYKVEKALSDRKEVLCCSEAQKKILKKLSSILIIPH